MGDDKDDFESILDAFGKLSDEMIARVEANSKRKQTDKTTRAEAKPKPPAEWEHPTLGSFSYDGTAWGKSLDVPAFAAFKYDFGSGDPPESLGRCDLRFFADDENDKPSKTAIALADKVLANQNKLVKVVIDALWDDFNGRGPDSGMYWHGDLDEIAAALEDADISEAPKRAEDLLNLIKLGSINVWQRVHGYEKPIVEFGFSAAFEEEHGLGVLTDGTRIIGLGYSADATPFKSAKGSK